MSRLSLPITALAALTLAACAEPTTAPSELLTAGPIANGPLPPQLSNGFPTGTTLYKFNLLGVPRGKTASMTGDQGKRMFVPLWGNAKIYLE